MGRRAMMHAGELELPAAGDAFWKTIGFEEDMLRPW
jgi:hypothetical protein